MLLNLKYRPRKFSDVLGQSHVAKMLKRVVKENRLAPAYMFVGPSGMGKTTLARCFSMALLCENIQDSEPCGVCDSCTEILEGTSFNYREIDAASQGSVDDMRRLVEQSTYGAIKGKRNVVYIDECFYSASRVLMADGRWERIGTLVNKKSNEKVLAYSDKLGKFVPRKITGHLRKLREQDWWELEFIFGRKVHCTPNHIFHTPLGEIRADQLVEGSKVWEYGLTFSRVQRQCVLGSVLGDAVLGQDPLAKMTRVCFKQSDVQKDYLHLKQKIMRPFIRTEAKKVVNGGWGDFIWPVQTQCLSIFDEVWDLVYRGLTKKGRPGRFVTRELLDQIDEVGLSFWFMDDGSMSWNKTSKGLHPGGFQFATHCFSYGEHLVMQQWFKDRWGIEVGIAEDNRGKGYYLSGGGKQKCEQLLSLVSPYLHKDHAHKAGYRVIGEFWETYQTEEIHGLVPSRVRYSGTTRAVREMNRHNWVYCLEVEEDHNFICEGKLVSNCHMLSKAGQNAILKLFEDGSKSTTYILATTEADRILHTVRARCMEMTIRPILYSDIADKLEQICKAEDIPYEREALDRIAMHTKTHVRDAINQMEQLSNMGDVTLASVNENLNLDLEQHYAQILLLINENPQEALDLLEEVTRRASTREIYQGLAEAALASVKSSLGVNPRSLIEKELLTSLYDMYGQSLLKVAEKLTKSYQQSKSGLVCDILQLRTVMAAEKPLVQQTKGVVGQPVTFTSPYEKLLSDASIEKQKGAVVEKDRSLALTDFVKVLSGELIEDEEGIKVTPIAAVNAESAAMARHTLNLPG